MSTNTSNAIGQGKRLLVINGGPRTEGNTAALLRQAVEGAQAAGATAEWVDLYRLQFRGCRSCFACKLRGGKSYGRCAQRDELSPILDNLSQACALLIGSPIYLGSVTGETRSFFERLLFPLFTYTEPPQSLFPGRLDVGMIYTLGATEQQASEAGYWQHLGLAERIMSLVFKASVERLASFDTYQFDDYSKFVADRFDPMHKANRRREVFPIDCRKARALGAKLFD